MDGLFYVKLILYTNPLYGGVYDHCTTEIFLFTKQTRTYYANNDLKKKKQTEREIPSREYPKDF